MGFALAGTGASVAIPIEISTNNKNKEIIEHNRAIREEYTPSGTKADIDLSEKVIQSINDITIDPDSSVDQIVDSILKVQEETATDNISNEAINTIGKKVHLLTKEALLNQKEEANRDALLKALGKTKEEVIQDDVFYSNLNAKMLFDNNQKAEPTEIERTTKEIKEFAKALGVDESVVTKSAETVKEDARNGWRGYNTFADKLNIVNSKLNDPDLTPEAKEQLEQDRDGLVFRLIALAANQNSKLEQFANAAEEISSGTVNSKKFTYKSKDGSFNLLGTHLASKPYESGYSAYGVVESQYQDIKAIQKILQSVPQDVVNAIAMQYNNIDTTGRVFDNFTSVDSLLNSFKASATAIRQRIKGEVKSNVTETSNSDNTNRIISKLDALVKGSEDSTTEAIYTTELRDISPEQTKDVKKAITNSKFKEDHKEDLTKKLDKIIALEETTKKEVAALEAKIKPLTNEANKLINDNSTEDISKTEFKDISRFEPVLRDIKRVGRELATIRDNEEVTKTVVALRDKFVEVRDKVNSLLAEEKARIEEEIKAKADKDSKNSDTEASNSENNEDTSIDTEKEVTSKTEASTTQEAIQNDKKSTIDHTKVEPKDYAVAELLDGSINNSATLAPENYEDHNGKGFNLSNELRVREKPESTIAIIKDVYKNIVRQVLPRINNLKLDMTDVAGTNGSLIKNPYAYFTKTNGKPGGMLLTSPHLRLLYNITTDGKNVDFEWNHVTIAAIDLSVRELLSSSSFDSILNPTSDYDVAKAFGMNPDTISSEQLQELRDVIKTYGVPRNALANRLGAVIMANLGLAKNEKTSTRGFYERVVVGLGGFALDYAAELKYFSTNVFDPVAFDEKRNSKLGHTDFKYTHVINNRIPTIKSTGKSTVAISDNFLGKRIEEGSSQRTEGLKSKYKLESSFDKEIRWSTVKSLPKNMYIKNTEKLATIPAFVKDTMHKLMNTPFEIDTDITDFLSQKGNLNALAERLKYTTTEDRSFLSFDDATSSDGVNISVTKQVGDLLKAAGKQKRVLRIPGEFKGIFFNYFMSKNGRLFIESSGLNPQANKSLQRFLCLPQAIYRTFDINDEMQIKGESFAIAQAFDSVGTNESIDALGERVNALSLDEIKQIREDLLHMSESTFKTTYKKLGLKGIENYGQALNVLQHLIRKKEADGKPFKTWLAIENDSTTSGYFIKFLQFANDNKLAEKTGIINSDSSTKHTEIHELKKEDGFLDIYQTMGANTAEHLPDVKKDLKTYKDDNGKKITVLEQLEYKNVAGMLIENPDAELETDIFLTMKNALPKPDKDGKVSSALRKLLKGPVMVFGYGAGESSIKRRLTEDIVNEFISTYMDIQKEGGLDSYIEKYEAMLSSDDLERLHSIVNTVELIGNSKTIKNKTLVQLLKENSIHNIWVKHGDNVYPMSYVFHKVLAPTYGNAVYKALKGAFSLHEQINSCVNDIFVNAFYMFNEVLQSKLDALEETYPNGIPNALYTETVHSLFDLWPAMKLAYGEDLKTDGMMLLMNTEKVRNKTSQAIHFKTITVKGKKTLDAVSLTGNVKEFVNPKKAGAVLPIHFIDGMMMAMLLNKHYEKGVVPVHDAVVMSAFDNKELTQQYNKDSYTIGMNYDLLSTIRDRLGEILKGYMEETGTGIDDILNTPIRDFKGAYKTKRDGKETVPYTYNDLLRELERLHNINNLNRKAFYSESNPVYITNMDGIEGSGVTVSPSTADIASRFKEAIEEEDSKFASGPRGYQTSTSIHKTIQQANTSFEGRVNLLDDLQNLSVATDNLVASDDHIKHLKTVIRQIAPERLINLIVQTTNTDANSGKLDGDVITLGFDDKVKDLDPVTKLSVYSTMSEAEIYAHEVVHAGVRLALANKDVMGFTNEVNQLFTLQKEASKIITWETFMPTKYDPSRKSMYEAHAKSTWEYIFNNSGKGLKGLHEFIAYGLTNEAMIKKLDKAYMPNVIKGNTTKLSDKLISLIKGIFDVLFGNSKFSDTFKFATEFIKGNNSLKRHSMLKELMRLQSKLSGTNNTAMNKFMKHPKKLSEYVFRLVGENVTRGNKFLSPLFDKAFNIADIMGKSRVFHVNITSTWMDKVKFLAESTALFTISKSRRKALKQVLNQHIGLCQQGTILSMFRDFTEPDLQSSRLELLSLLTRSVDTSSKALEATSYLELKEGFGKDLNELEDNSLTHSLLYTDAQALMRDEKDIPHIKELLTDDNKLDKEIDTTTNSIRSMSNNAEWVLNQARGLALFMVTGKGNLAQNLNATNIAEGRLLDTPPIAADSKLVQLIDKLASLEAIRITDKDLRKVTASLSDKGLFTFLNIHKTFVNESVSGVKVEDRTGKVSLVQTVESIFSVKGYTKQLLDTSYDMKIDITTPAKIQEMRSADYALVHTIKEDKITNTGNLGIYRRSFATPNRRDGSSFVLNGAHAKGTSLRDSASMLANNINTTKYDFINQRALWQVFYKNALKESRALHKLMASKPLSIKEIEKYSANYTPIISPTSSAPADFRITMSNELKTSLLGMDTRGLTILSKMYASSNTKVNASISNKMLIDFIKNDVANNMISTTKRNAEGQNYILLQKNTDNKYLKEAWNVIPKELLEEIEAGDFYVREDWLLSLFGVPSGSLNDLKVVKGMTSVGGKRLIAISEYFMKNIARIVKRHIIMLIPKVLVGNISSNIAFSAMNGADPITVFKLQVANGKAIRDYIDTKKSLNRILFKERIGTATVEESKSKNWHISKLESNMVHPLMEKGMYQSIVEDINPEELESIGKVQKMLKNSKIVKHIPKFIKNISKHLYMAEGTPIYDFMFQLTQYSDFVARATEYQLKMRKAPTRYKNGVQTSEYTAFEEKLSIHILNAFINYDKPQSKAEQYLNDIGLMMFTKFAKRIQPIVNGSALNNPIGVLMFLIGQYSIMDTEDIMEQNVFSKHWSALFHNPVDNFVDAITPMPVQYYFGMKSMW